MLYFLLLVDIRSPLADICPTLWATCPLTIPALKLGVAAIYAHGFKAMTEIQYSTPAALIDPLTASFYMLCPSRDRI